MSVNTCDVPVPTIPVECKDLPPQLRYIVNVGATRSGKTATFKRQLIAQGYNEKQINKIMEKVKQNKALKVQENKGVPEDKLKIARSQRVVKKRS